MNSILYPYDPTGEAIANQVVTSIDLPRVRNRAFAPDGAPFYKDSVVIKTKSTGVELPKSSYEILRLNVEATVATDKSVGSIINITDENYYGEIEAVVQAVGGTTINNAATIQKMLDVLAADGRTVKFSDLIDVPVTMPPSPHLTYVGDLYGAETIVEALDRITASNSQSTEVTLELLNDRYNRIFASIDTLTELTGLTTLDVDLLKQQVTDNLTRTSNLIRQLTLTVTNNYAGTQQDIRAIYDKIASQAVELTKVTNTFTILNEKVDVNKKTYDDYVVEMGIIINTINSAISAHIAKYNEHVVKYNATVSALATLTQRVGVDEQALTTHKTAYNAHVVKYNATVSALTTLTNRVTATESVATAANNRSTTNANNITAINNRTSNINNYATATTSQTVAGTATNLHTTPAGVKAAIAALAVPAEVPWTVLRDGTELTDVTLGIDLSGKEICLVGSDTSGNDEVAVTVTYVPSISGFDSDCNCYIPFGNSHAEYKYSNRNLYTAGDMKNVQVWYRTPATNAYPAMGTLKPGGNTGSSGGGTGGGTGGGDSGVIGGGGCLLQDVPITMADGSVKPIQDIKIGDKVKSYYFRTMKDSSLDDWKEFTTNTNDVLKSTISTVVAIRPGSYHKHFVINSSLKITQQHEILVARGTMVSWMDARDIRIGDSLFTEEMKLKRIDTIDYIEHHTPVYDIDVEDVDTYCAGGYVVHNADEVLK